MDQHNDFDMGKARGTIARLLLQELKEGLLNWWYISVANEQQFLGGVFIRARGPTEAWVIFHHLQLCPKWMDASTAINGPVSDEYMARVPADKRLCLVTKEDLDSLDKE